MRPMTRGATGSAQILFLQERNAMHALEVQLELVRRNAVWFHQFDVGVATGAERRNVQGIYLCGRIFYFLRSVAIVAHKARCHLCVALCQFLPMRARLIFGPLIGWQIVLPHLFDVRVAARAQSWNIHGFRYANVSGAARFRIFFSIQTRVAAMTIHAGHIAFRVNAGLPVLHRIGKAAALLRVAVYARIFVRGLHVGNGGGKKDRRLPFRG